MICIKEDGIDDVHTRHNMKDNGYPCHEHQLLHHLVTAGASLGHLTSSALSSAVSAAITGPWIVKLVQFRYIYIYVLFFGTMLMLLLTQLLKHGKERKKSNSPFCIQNSKGLLLKILQKKVLHHLPFSSINFGNDADVAIVCLICWHT